MRWALAITGPTASGKTEISLRLAELLEAEIICLDSMQIYKGMDIGTAKPTKEDRARVRHHLVDFVPFSQSYNAENYKTDALLAVDDILLRGKVPLFVGGTGLYLDTLTGRGDNAAPESDKDYINERAEAVKTQDDAHCIWEKLSAVDPQSAEKIHENNIKRVLRALEIYEKSGKTKTYFDKLSKEKAPPVKVGLITLDFHLRELLYGRVNARVEAMINEGLVDECRRLFDDGLFGGDFTAAQAIGYKELGEYISGKCTLEEAKERLKLATRHYAKRQLTWFKHERDAYRLYLDSEDGVIRSASEILSEAVSVSEGYLNKFINKIT